MTDDIIYHYIYNLSVSSFFLLNDLLIRRYYIHYTSEPGSQFGALNHRGDWQPLKIPGKRLRQPLYYYYYVVLLYYVYTHCTRARVRAEVSYIIICMLYDVGSTIKVVLNAFSCHIGVYRNSFRGDKLYTNVYNNTIYERLCTAKYTLYNSVPTYMFIFEHDYTRIILSTSLLFFIEINALNACTRNLIIVDKKNYNHQYNLFKNDNIKFIMYSIFYNNLNHDSIHYSQSIGIETKFIISRSPKSQKGKFRI